MVCLLYFTPGGLSLEGVCLVNSLAMAVGVGISANLTVDTDPAGNHVWPKGRTRDQSTSPFLIVAMPEMQNVCLHNLSLAHYSPSFQSSQHVDLAMKL